MNSVRSVILELLRAGFDNTTGEITHQTYQGESTID